MQTTKPTREQIEGWKATFAAYRPRLRPNRKTAEELIATLRARYPVVEMDDERWKQTVILNVTMNPFSAKKLPAGQAPEAVVFRIRNEGAGEVLYERQREPFLGLPITVGVERVTGEFHVEGSADLWDELFAFRGLDAADLENFYLVAEYIGCLEKAGTLEETLATLKA